MEQPAEMQDSDVAIPAADEPEQVIDQQDEAEAGDQLDAEGNPVVTDQAESDEEEIDYDGEKFKVPKKLQEAFLRQQDYTQKTQAVAEQRKALEAQAEQIKQQEQAQRQNIAEYAEAYALDAQLKQYAALDWQQLIDSDPQQAMKLDRQMRELQQRRDAVVASVTQKQQQQALLAQQETAKRLQEGRAVLEREIKGWSPEVAKELKAFGKEVGFKDEELDGISDPRAVKLLYQAYQFNQLMKKQATPKEKPKPQEKPVTRITATKGTATKDPSQMTDAEFAAFRKRQIAQRR